MQSLRGKPPAALRQLLLLLLVVTAAVAFAQQVYPDEPFESRRFDRSDPSHSSTQAIREIGKKMSPHSPRYLIDSSRARSRGANSLGLESTVSFDSFALHDAETELARPEASESQTTDGFRSSRSLARYREKSRMGFLGDSRLKVLALIGVLVVVSNLAHSLIKRLNHNYSKPEEELLDALTQAQEALERRRRVVQRRVIAARPSYTRYGFSKQIGQKTLVELNELLGSWRMLQAKISEATDDALPAATEVVETNIARVADRCHVLVLREPTPPGVELSAFSFNRDLLSVASSLLSLVRDSMNFVRDRAVLMGSVKAAEAAISDIGALHLQCLKRCGNLQVWAKALIDNSVALAASENDAAGRKLQNHTLSAQSEHLLQRLNAARANSLP